MMKNILMNVYVQNLTAKMFQKREVRKFPDMFVETKPKILRQKIIFSEAEPIKPASLAK